MSTSRRSSQVGNRATIITPNSQNALVAPTLKPQKKTWVCGLEGLFAKGRWVGMAVLARFAGFGYLKNLKELTFEAGSIVNVPPEIVMSGDISVINSEYVMCDN